MLYKLISKPVFCKKSPEENRFNALKQILKSWIECNDEYSRIVDTEPSAPWWYGERSSTGLLSAAAWRQKGWIALEEYGVSKIARKTADSEKQNNRNLFSGRCDLFIANKNFKCSFAFEAKIAWQNIGPKVKEEKKLEKVKTALQLAFDDARKLPKEEALTRAGLCFVVPRISGADRLSDTEIENLLEHWLNELLNKINWEAAAWVFPESTRRLTSADSPKACYPGTILLLRSVRRSH